MKVVTIVGARPQFIKAGPLSRALEQAGYQELMIHTGQHYDEDMSEVFFRDLGLRKPDVNLHIGSSSHGQQTGQMLIGIEEVLLRERPRWVVVFGDTNSTIAGALAASKLLIPVAHIEAGLRSYNRAMPEEQNRVLTDHISDLLFCPTPASVANLAREGITRNVHCVGDIMNDALLQQTERVAGREGIFRDLGLAPGGYLLVTVHRPVNTDDPARLHGILNALGKLGRPVVFPVHPRTRPRVDEFFAGSRPDHVHIINPVGYLEMIALQRNAHAILTDSGGVQKEAFFLSIPCLTLRAETEWTETVDTGWNRLVDTDTAAIMEAVASLRRPEGSSPPVFGDGRSAVKIVEQLGA